jgi:hypothetical protein
MPRPLGERRRPVPAHRLQARNGQIQQPIA